MNQMVKKVVLMVAVFCGAATPVAAVPALVKKTVNFVDKMQRKVLTTRTAKGKVALGLVALFHVYAHVKAYGDGKDKKSFAGMVNRSLSGLFFSTQSPAVKVLAKNLYINRDGSCDMSAFEGEELYDLPSKVRKLSHHKWTLTINLCTGDGAINFGTDASTEEGLGKGTISNNFPTRDNYALEIKPALVESQSLSTFASCLSWAAIVLTAFNNDRDVKEAKKAAAEAKKSLAVEEALTVSTDVPAVA